MNAKSVLCIIILLSLLGTCKKQFHIKSISQENAFLEVGKLSLGKYGHTSVSSGKNIYIIGGFKNSTASFTGSIEVFNAENHSISILSTQIVPRRYLGAVMVDSNIYIIGGEKHPGDIPFNTSIISKTTGIFEKYDLRTNEIITLPEIPTARQYMGVVTINNKIYIIGGSQFKSLTSDHYGHVMRYGDGQSMRYSEDTVNPYIHYLFLSSMEIYNINSNTWEEGPPMPTARQCNAVLYNNKIYIIGGFNGRPLDNFEVFDIEKNKWEISEDAPVSMSAHSCIENNGSIYIFGDYDKQKRVLVYNTESKKWTNIDSNYEGSRHQSAVCINNAIYIFSGYVLPPANDISIIQKYKTL